MKRFRSVLLPVSVLAIFCVAWLWWNHSDRVDMAATVPGDSLVYLEADSLPQILRAVTGTDAWKTLAPVAGVGASFGSVGWLSRLAAWTGIGPADAVVFARAQVAVAVLNFETTAGSVKPRAAAVIETHTGERRTRAAIEKRVGDFAQHAYSNIRVERKQLDGAEWTTWSQTNTSSDETDRRIIAAITGSLAVIGNDEQAVRACLAVHNGERPSLAVDRQMTAMRGRVASNESLAFGYVSPAGAAKLLEVAAAVYASQISLNPRAQSFAASLLPQLAGKVLGSIGWSARSSDGQIEDRYFLSLQNGVAARLRDALAPSPSLTFNAGEFLPAGTYSTTRYNYLDPSAAWRGLNDAVSSQLDSLSASLVQTFLNAALQPYGIEDPSQFFRAIGSEIVTARLDDTGESTVLMAEVRDEKALRTLVARRLGASARIERVGETEMLVSRDATREAAAFVAGHLIVGSRESLRRCLVAYSEHRTLASTNSFQLTARSSLAANVKGALTLTNDERAARELILFVAAQSGARPRAADKEELKRALESLRFAVTETRPVEEGFERITHSSFGQFGALARLFSDDEQKQR
ncbi:MAG: hypothetical protein ABR577_10040 [Pyrinomonadaceae bacterium]